jgi:hypothetical protein
VEKQLDQKLEREEWFAKSTCLAKWSGVKKLRMSPSHGEEVVHHTDRHDLLLPPSACVLLLAQKQ